MMLNAEDPSVDYVDHLGTDLLVVNAARASFNSGSSWQTVAHNDLYDGAVIQMNPRIEYRPTFLKKADADLIRFLASGYRTKEWNELLDTIMACRDRDELSDILRAYKNRAQHWAPFGHPHVTLKLAMPMFVARQMVKHQVGGGWSEESRRYVSEDRNYYPVEEWHNRPPDIKQGAGSAIDAEMQQFCQELYQQLVKTSDAAYQQLREAGVAPEEARMVLPLTLMTHVTWTGSLLFWARVCNQRSDSHAQSASRQLAKMIEKIVAPLFPVSWKNLVYYNT